MKFKKQKIDIVFNYSNIELSPDMIKLLNRGLNYCILPKDLDITQLLTDLKKFERTMLWTEFWYGKESDHVNDQNIFKKIKTNLPKNHPTPSGLKIYLAAVKSDILDPQNRHNNKNNITPGEKQALSALISLQKQKKIVIKPCDKGAGIIVLNHKDYIESCVNHLNSKLTLTDGSAFNYYEQVDNHFVNKTKSFIKLVLEEGLDNNILTKEEFSAMNPEDKTPGKFYCTYKVHKKHSEGSIPPERPIISASGSFNENLGKFIEHHIKHLADKHPSYIKDTPCFLRQLNAFCESDSLPDNAILVSMDISALYTNIPQDEGLQYIHEALCESNTNKIPPEYLIKLLKIILSLNVFEFNDTLYRQVIGTAMGSIPSVSYANIFCAKVIDNQLTKILKKYENKQHLILKFYKRFLDDLFFIFYGSTKKLHDFFNEMNSIHQNIKFTMTHTSISESEPCECKEMSSISFLDTSLSVRENKIDVDLYRKPTDRNQYLLPSSCHPPECVRNIPYSLALRIVRIVTDPVRRDERLDELSEMLLSREYPNSVVRSAIQRAKELSRDQALKISAKPSTQSRPIFGVSFDPRIPNLFNITRKHWRSMTTTDNYLKDVFPQPPMIAYRRPKNIREFIIKAKLFKNSRTSERILPGMKKCNKPCAICPYVKTTKFIKGDNFTWNIRKNVNCKSLNVIYMIQCEKCKQCYIGETENFARRVYQHVGYVKSNVLTEPTGEHFNGPGHNIEHLKALVIEKVKKPDIKYRKEREHYLINKFNTFYRGINKKS